LVKAISSVLFCAWAYRLTRIALGVVFIAAGALKLSDVSGFAQTIGQFGLVPLPLVTFTAIFLPVLEVVAGIGLLFDVKGSLTAIAIMLAMFLVILWLGIVRDLEIDCGCFSREEQDAKDSLAQAFYRDILFAGMAMYLYLWRWRRGATRIRQPD
jgi:uncharacterized membrane protein YphA (DoxX/SURF4 family)